MPFNTSHQDSPSNHGPLINVISWWFVVTSFLVVLARVGTKLAILRKISIDDIMIFIAMVFSVGQTVATNFEASNGLGQHIDQLSSSQIEGIQKSLYAANILFFGSQCFAKMSLALFIRRISPVTFHLRLSLAIIIGIIIWTITSIVPAFFKCRTPDTWRFIDNKCIDRAAFWNYSNTVNLFLDGLLIMLPMIVVWKLQVSFSHKFAVMACFSTRIFTMAAIILQMVLINRSKDTTDFSFDYWPTTLTTTVVQSFGIITACVPYLKPFLESLDSGMIRTDDMRRRHGTATYQSSSSKSNGLPRTAGFRLKGNSKLTSGSKKKEEVHELQPLSLDPNLAGGNVAYITSQVNDENKRDWDLESQSSRAKIITQTTTWGVVTSGKDAPVST